MKIGGKNFTVNDTFDNVVTIPDCFVLGKNKLGHGHGEAKLYFGPKESVRQFYGGEGFQATCFLLKEDIIAYLTALKGEYMHPSQSYVGKDDMPKLWEERLAAVGRLDSIIYFNVSDQLQIEGGRGYVNSNGEGYKLIREISLPLVSYLSVMQLTDDSGRICYYWKLFVDFDAISERKNGPLVFTYGRKERQTKKDKKEQEINRARIGQGKYRESLLEECPYCPITMVNDERLLIASHIKPWASSSDKEKIDPKNGYMFTPLYDRLFDRGFITFTEDKHMHISNWLSPRNCKRLGLKDDVYIQHLPMDEKRKEYLKYHREVIFKG